MPQWERTASELHAFLLELPPAAGCAATSSAIQSLSAWIAELLNAAGLDAGAVCLRIVGTILSYSHVPPSLKANERGAVTVRNANGGKTAITDVLLADVTKSIVTESASLIRTVTFLTSLAYNVPDGVGKGPSRGVHQFDPCADPTRRQRRRDGAIPPCL